MGFACYDAYKEENFIWFSAIDHNGLYKINIDNNEMVRVAEFPEEDDIFELHRKVIVYNRVLYFIPYKGNGISTYNLDTHEMDYFTPHDENELHASDAFLEDDIIWILPRSLNQPLYEFNITHKKLYPHEEWNNRILKLYGLTNNHILSLTSTCFVNSTMMTVIYNTSYVIKTSIKTWNIESFYISDEYHLRGIAYDAGSYWITLSKGGSILYVDLNHNRINIIDLDCSGSAVFMNAIVDDQSVILLPCKDTGIYRIDREQKQSYLYQYDIRLNKAKQHLPWFMGWMKDENRLYILPSAVDEIVEYNREKEKKVDFILRDFKHLSISMYESGHQSLLRFLEIVDSYHYIDKSHNDSNTHGKKIWEVINTIDNQ